MKNRLLQGLLTKIVIQWGPRLAQEQRQRIPSFEQVADRVTEGRIRLDQFLVELALQPGFQVVHGGLAVGLVIR